MNETKQPPQQWLQIKGDPSIRNFVFQQSRTPSLFDLNIDRLMAVTGALVLMHGRITSYNVCYTKLLRTHQRLHASRPAQSVPF